MGVLIEKRRLACVSNVPISTVKCILLCSLFKAKLQLTCLIVKNVNLFGYVFCSSCDMCCILLIRHAYPNRRAPPFTATIVAEKNLKRTILNLMWAINRQFLPSSEQNNVTEWFHSEYAFNHSLFAPNSTKYTVLTGCWTPNFGLIMESVCEVTLQHGVEYCCNILRC